MAKPIPSDSPPGDLPDPPRELNAEKLLILNESGPWYRLNPISHPLALYFDKSGYGRFDGPQQSYGILYLGADLHVCVIECFGRTLTRAVDEAELKSRNLFMLQSQCPLRLVDLTGAGLIRAGADSRLNTGSYAQARKWIQAIWNLTPPPDGIRYRSRLDNDRFCYGLFDRTQASLAEFNQGNLIDAHAYEVAQVLNDYDFVLL
jgi:hypothetical protein